MSIPSPTNRSSLLGRWWTAMVAGLSFGGKRNLYDVYGYPQNLRPEDLLAKYERQDITSRIVNVPPEETWSNPPKIVADDGFLTAWEALVKKHKLWSLLTQADKLLAFGEFSILFLGAPGKPDTPLQQVSLDRLAYIMAFGASNVSVSEVVRDPSNPRFGKPLFYDLKTAATDPVSIRAHYTRVVHLVDAPLMGDVLSIPRLKQVYNLLDDILKIGGGSAETFWITANRGMQVDVDKDMELGVDDAKALSDELEEFQHQLRRFVRTRGVKITNLGSDVADPSGVFRVLISLLASATGIPQRILMGSEAGQLASEQDRANWAEYIERRRKTFAQPFVLIPTIERFQQLTLLPESSRLEFVWPEAFHLSPLERAQTMAQSARAVINLSREAQYGFPIVTLEEARTIIGLPEKPKGTLPPSYDQIKAEFAPESPEDDPEDDDPEGEGTRARPARKPAETDS